MCNIIRRFFIFPGSESQGKYDQLPLPYQDFVIAISTDEGHQISLLYGDALPNDNDDSFSQEPYSLLYFYGNGMCLLNATYEFDYFRKLGLNVTISEYIGFGLSSGVATEEGCQQTARAAYKYLTNEKGISCSRILVAGWSLGAAVATYLAKMVDVAGLILLSPFTNIYDEASQLFPFIPQSIFPKYLLESVVSDQFDNLGRITHVRCPIFIAHGTLDDIVPFNMGDTLCKKAEESGKKITFFPIEDARHNDIFEAGGKRLRREIRHFVSSLSD
ncbi:alpha/beta hydrolase [Fortiea contorta]|uniref:alpha/beta hydrolase n=1 Tax=Fortiea contorta TaxID=1892405 RepID=UPI00034A697E|nr:alpha/beta hydrolase [Fortiea contorta]